MYINTHINAFTWWIAINVCDRCIKYVSRCQRPKNRLVDDVSAFLQWMLFFVLFTQKDCAPKIVQQRFYGTFVWGPCTGIIRIIIWREKLTRQTRQNDVFASVSLGFSDHLHAILVIVCLCAWSYDVAAHRALADHLGGALADLVQKHDFLFAQHYLFAIRCVNVCPRLY